MYFVCYMDNYSLFFIYYDIRIWKCIIEDNNWFLDFIGNNDFVFGNRI